MFLARPSRLVPFSPDAPFPSGSARCLLLVSLCTLSRLVAPLVVMSRGDHLRQLAAQLASPAAVEDTVAQRLNTFFDAAPARIPGVFLYIPSATFALPLLVTCTATKTGATSSRLRIIVAQWRGVGHGLRSRAPSLPRPHNRSSSFGILRTRHASTLCSMDTPNAIDSMDNVLPSLAERWSRPA